MPTPNAGTPGPRSAETALWLVGEVNDLLDAGAVGLYEFLWLLRGAGSDVPARTMRMLSTEALRLLLLDDANELCWLVWPDGNAVAGPRRVMAEDGDWAAPSSGAPYLALVRVRATPG